MYSNECWERRKVIFPLAVLVNIWLWPHVTSGVPAPLTVRGCGTAVTIAHGGFLQFLDHWEVAMTS